MITFEEIFQKIFSDKNWLPKILIGGLLAFIPILQFFSFGYIYAYTSQVRKTGYMTLPKWDNWQTYFVKGLYFTLVLIIYWALPIALGWTLAILFSSIFFGFFGILAFIPLALMCVLSPTLFISALYQLQVDGEWEALMHIKPIFKRLTRTWKSLIIPSFVYWGINALGIPLYGITLFVSFIILAGYTTVVFVLDEQNS